MCEMSMMGMTQIGAQVIIIRKNISKNYHASQNEKVPSCMPNATHGFVGIKGITFNLFIQIFVFSEAQNVMQHLHYSKCIGPDTNTISLGCKICVLSENCVRV